MTERRRHGASGGPGASGANGPALADHREPAQPTARLAFSCWILDGRGRTLLAQRSARQRLWPGLWDTGLSGTADAGQTVEDAVHRRAWEHLGARLLAAGPVSHDTKHREPDAVGTESTSCPVFTARLADSPRPDPIEVAHIRWMPLDALPHLVTTNPELFTPWLRQQLPRLLSHAHLPADRPARPTPRSSAP